jgi:hypothetical protein
MVIDENYWYSRNMLIGGGRSPRGVDHIAPQTPRRAP